MEIKESKTYRGFKRLAFFDNQGSQCSLQMRSDGIWLGVDFANPVIMASDAKKLGIETSEKTGLINFPVPEQVQFTTRMQLNREQVRALLPILKKFVYTGEI